MALSRALFTENTVEVLHVDKWSAVAKKYLPGIDSSTINNGKGHVEVLPFTRQIIWDAPFSGKSLWTTSMFPEPRLVTLIEDTYGYFAFHSGLLAAGCPSPEDTHPLRGEFSYAPMDFARLIATDSAAKVGSSRKYLGGFGDHYLARSSVTLREGSSVFDIHLQVTSLSKYVPMLLQYTCHTNYAFVPGGIISQSLPDGAFRLHRPVPVHVKLIPQRIQLNEDTIAGKKGTNSLIGTEGYDPEIVFFADGVNKHTDYAVFDPKAPDSTVLRAEFGTADSPVVTRWILHNADQKVVTFALSGTLRPEGCLVAQGIDILIQLAVRETREFNVHIGMKEG